MLSWPKNFGTTVAPRCSSIPSCLFTVRNCEAWVEDSDGLSLPRHSVSLVISDLPHTAPRVWKAGMTRFTWHRSQWWPPTALSGIPSSRSAESRWSRCSPGSWWYERFRKLLPWLMPAPCTKASFLAQKGWGGVTGEGQAKINCTDFYTKGDA